MSNHLPIVSQLAGKRQPTPKLSTYSEAKTQKLIKVGGKKKRDFELRLNTEVNEYSAVRDRFLEQFFRRQTRMKILNALPKDRKSENISSMRNPQNKKQSPNKSNFHNIRQEANISQLAHREISPMSKKETEQGFNLKLPNKRSTKLTRIRTLAKDKTHLASSHELSREQFSDFLTKAKEKLLAKSQFQHLPSN